jgi:hypothetical protein
MCRGNLQQKRYHRAMDRALYYRASSALRTLRKDGGAGSETNTSAVRGPGVTEPVAGGIVLACRAGDAAGDRDNDNGW